MPNFLKLHLGCGDKNIAGYVNVDRRADPAVDKVADIWRLSDYFPISSAEVIYSAHALIHCPRGQYKDVLRDWLCVLAPGGTLRLSVTDFAAVVDHYNFFQELGLLQGLLNARQDYPENTTRMIWDFKSLKRDLEEAGFVKVRRYDWRLTEHSHVDDFSQAYLPHMDKENGRLMSLNVEANCP